MTGYVRKDTTNNIADGNVINAADLDSEFDGVQAAFNSSTGHTHDGSSAEGAPITKLGPVQDVTISTTVLGVKTTNTVDLGTSSLKFKDFYLAGNASIGGTLTYGGVTLSNAVTGTGSMVLSASPTITGTITAAAANFSGAVAFNGTTTIGDADTDTITQAASYVTGTQLKSAKTATNTLSLAAYDVDGTAYTNLITLTAGNTPTLALTSTGVGTINNMSIGATTASTGAFTTLSATGAITSTSSGNSTVTTGIFENTSTGTSAINRFRLNGGTSSAFFEMQGSGFSGTNITNGPTTSALVVWTGSNIPVSIGVNASEIGRFSSTGLAVTGTFSSTLGATIQALTVGKGTNAISGNTVFGEGALQGANSGTGFNVAIGYQAGYNNTSGQQSIYIGQNAGYFVTTGSYNVAIGTVALQGSAVGTSTGSNNVAVGLGALSANTTASNNTAVGFQAGYSNTTGAQNVYVGPSSGYYNQTGAENTFVGFSANGNGTGGSAGSYNTAVGRAAMNNNYGSYNTALGNGALQLNTSAINNTAVGYQAGYTNQTGSNNTALGYQAGYYNTAANNTFIGTSAGLNTTSAINTFIGYGAGYLVTSGAKNTIIGNYSGNQGGLDIRTASNYIVLSDGDGNPRVVVNGSGYYGFGTVAPLSKFDSYAGAGLASVQRSESSNAAAIATNVVESRVTNFSVISGTNSVITNATVSASGWRVIFRGTWSNNYEGGGLAFYAPYIELNSVNPSTTIGSRTLTVSRNGSGYLVVNSGDAYYITFAGTIEVYDNPQSQQPSQSMRLLGGIQFPATQNDSSNANTLDDYEEGTFTPTIGGATTAGTGTYPTDGQVGRYTKIGNRCTFVIWLNWTNLTGSSGFLQVYGLPFTQKAVTNVYTPLTVYMDTALTLSANNVFQAYIIGSSTNIFLSQYATGGGNAATISLDTAAAIMISGTYETS